MDLKRTSSNSPTPIKTGLYFGTFNPIHLGHLVIANHMATHADLDEVWLVVTPLNPQKNPSELIDQNHRLQMVRLAVSDNEKLQESDVEFGLPQPNYTAQTMRKLRDEHPDRAFSVIIGEDNFNNLHGWKDHLELISNHAILVYPRRHMDPSESPTVSPDTLATAVPRDHPNIIWCNAPMISISSTYLRRTILDHKDIRYLLPDKVLNYISNNHLYE